MRQFWALITKEFLHIRRDPRTLGIILFAPVIMLLFFGYAVNFDIQHIKVLVCDQDLSQTSRELVASFSHSEYFTVVGYIDKPDRLIDYLDSGQARLVLWIPPGFGRKITAGQKSELFGGIDGADSNAATISLGYFAGFIRAYSTRISLSRIQRTGQANLARQLIPFQVAGRIWYNSELKSSHYIVPGLISTLLMMLVTLLTAMSITGEKERNTFEQLAASPIKPWQLILGKIIPYAAASFIGVLLIIPAGIFLFGVPLRGSWLDLFIFILIFLVTTLALGLLFSMIAKTQQQAMMLAAAGTLLPSMLLSGFMFPVESMPWFLQLISNFVPARFFLIALRGIFLKGVSLKILWPEFLALTVVAAILTLVSIFRFKKRID
jgi:ABC-2 type transport system permease protein